MHRVVGRDCERAGYRVELWVPARAARAAGCQRGSFRTGRAVLPELVLPKRRAGVEDWAVYIGVAAVGVVRGGAGLGDNQSRSKRAFEPVAITVLDRRFPVDIGGGVGVGLCA